VFLKYIVNKF